MNDLIDTGRDETYMAEGYRDRADYLSCLAEDYGADLDAVVALANLLGPDEDFDGLIVSVQDM